MVRRNLARYMKTALLGPADLLERSFRGEVCDVQPRAGEFGELNVARNTNGFRGRGHSGKTKTRGRDAFAHDGAGRERNIFRMLDDRKIERAAVVHHLPCEFCRGDGFSVVANGDDAGLLHGGNFRDGFAFAADAGGADGPNANAGGGFGAVENEARDAGIVVDRFRVRHAADGGEAAASRGARAGLDGFRRFLAGLAKMRVKVDEAGSDDEAGGVEDFRRGILSDFSRLRDFDDFVAVEKHIARRVRLRGWVNDAAVLNEQHA